MKHAKTSLHTNDSCIHIGTNCVADQQVRMSSVSSTTHTLTSTSIKMNTTQSYVTAMPLMEPSTYPKYTTDHPLESTSDTPNTTQPNQHTDTVETMAESVSNVTTEVGPSRPNETVSNTTHVAANRLDLIHGDFDILDNVLAFISK